MLTGYNSIDEPDEVGVSEDVDDSGDMTGGSTEPKIGRTFDLAARMISNLSDRVAVIPWTRDANLLLSAASAALCAFSRRILTEAASNSTEVAYSLIRAY